MLQTATKSTTPVSLATFKQWLSITSNSTKTITSLTSSGTVATAVCASHGYSTNQFVTIAGAVTSGYNGSYLITVVDANTFTFPLAATATSPATGTPTVTPDDGRYAAIVDAAADDFLTYTNVPLVKTSFTETFSGDNKTAHALQRAPIVSIDAFTIDGTTVKGTPYTVASPPTSTDYYVDGEAGIIEFTGATTQTPFGNGGFNFGVRNIVVTYTTGYDAQDGAALPFDAVRAVLDLAKAIHDTLVSNAIAATSVSLGPSTMVIRPAARPQDVQAVFDAWRAKGYRP